MRYASELNGHYYKRAQKYFTFAYATIVSPKAHLACIKILFKLKIFDWNEMVRASNCKNINNHFAYNCQA